MKKILALVLSVVMVFGLVACGETAPETSAQGGEQTQGGEQAAFTTVQEGKLIMATNAAFPPYEFVDADGSTFVGIDVEIADMIAKELGLTLEVQDMEFASILTAVQSGKADIALAGLTVTEDRLKNVNFSTSYATGVQAVIVKDGGAIASIDDIKSDGSMKIGVQESTTGHIYAADTVENGGYGEENVIPYATGALAVQALVAGKVDCVIIDNNPANEYVKANPGLKVLDTPYTEEQYAAAFSKDNEPLLAAFDEVLQAKIADGTVQSIIDKYIAAK